MKTQEIIVQRIQKLGLDIQKSQKSMKNSKLELENVKAEAKLFPRIYDETCSIAEDIAFCCDKIISLDSLLTQSIERKFKDQVVQYEREQIKACTAEEERLK